jgi:hypothetical protein
MTLAELLAWQIQAQPRQRCACATQHGGGHYVFLGPDGGRCRCSNFPCGHLAVGQARRCRIHPPRGRGIQPIHEGAPLACWLPVKFGLTPHGLRHSHKTWMAEDGTPEILAEQRLGHEGARHARPVRPRLGPDARPTSSTLWWPAGRTPCAPAQPSTPTGPVPLLDELLAPFRERVRQKSETAAPRETVKQPKTPGDREKMISNSSQPCRKPQPGKQAGAQGTSF